MAKMDDNFPSFTIYEAQQNMDMTEGKGPMRTFATFTSEALAVEAVKGKGVMGVGDGEVERITFYPQENGTVERQTVKIYGYHKSLDGWRHGYVDDRDLAVDPEWADYVRLRNKFGG